MIDEKQEYSEENIKETPEKNPEEARKEELRQRIREAEAKIDAVQEEIDADREMRELEEKARLKENAARDMPHIKKAEEKYDEIRSVNTPLGAVVLKKPGHQVFRRFTRKANSNKPIDDNDVWDLVKPCIVYPDIARVETIVEEYPATTMLLGEKAMELAKGKSAEIEGK